MRQDRLHDMMARRSPLSPREVVAPVDLYASQIVDKATSGQTQPGTQRRLNEPGGPHSDKTESQHVDKAANQYPAGTDAVRRRYTTYLRPDTIKAVKWLAVDEERNDYEIVQQAVDEYLQRIRGSP